MLFVHPLAQAANHVQLSTAIQNEGVALRLEAGSDEAGYLAAIFPLPKIPTLVIIKKGDLKGYIAAGTSKEDFLSRSLAALGPSPQSQPSGLSHSSEATGQTQAPVASTHDQASSSTNAAASTSSSPSAASPTPTQTEEAGAGLRSFYAERREREEARRQEEGRKEKEARAARAAAAASDMSPHAVETRKHAEKIKKQRQDAADERARVLRRIQDDKLERHARAAASKQPKIGDVAASIASAQSSSMKPSTHQAAIQVRLFDGSSLRTRFQSTKTTLKGDVRQWIDGNRTDGSEPYRFKLLLTPPQASRKIDETEEGKTLAELGLAPSSTLVLTPVRNYAEAYSSPRSGIMGLPFVVFGFFAGLLAWIWGLVSGVFSGLRGRASNRGQAREEQERAANEEQAARVREQRKGKFAQFANPDDRRGEQQLYNGNSVSGALDSLHRRLYLLTLSAQL